MRSDPIESQAIAYQISEICSIPVLIGSKLWIATENNFKVCSRRIEGEKVIEK